MKRIAMPGLALLVALLAVGTVTASAQQPSHQQHPAPVAPPASGAPAPPGGGAPGHHMPMSGGMMQGGMCEMMMGMMGGQANSPRMLQMRGEMMKAMGEIMMKHGKMMETPAR